MKTGPITIHRIWILWRQDLLQYIASEFYEDRTYYNTSHLNSMKTGYISVNRTWNVGRQDLFHYTAFESYKNKVYFTIHLHPMKTGPIFMHRIWIMWRQDLFHWNASESMKTGPISVHRIWILWRQDLFHYILPESYEDRAYFNTPHLNSMKRGPISIHLTWILLRQDLFHYTTSESCEDRTYFTTSHLNPAKTWPISLHRIRLLYAIPPSGCFPKKKSMPDFFMLLHLLQPCHVFVVTQRSRYHYRRNIIKWPVYIAKLRHLHLGLNISLNTLLSSTPFFSHREKLLFKLHVTADKVLVYCVYINVLELERNNNCLNWKMTNRDLHLVFIQLFRVPFLCCLYQHTAYSDAFSIYLLMYLRLALLKMVLCSRTFMSTYICI
jgi:hypothetical protein